MSKRQTSCDSSSFGTESIDMKQCCEYIRGIRYRLCIMSIAVDGPAYIFSDNKYVLCNTTIPYSILKKKEKIIA